MLKNGIWEFPEQLDWRAKHGFVYFVYDEYMNKAYIGQKPLKRKAKGIVQESNWQVYKTSSETIKAMLQERPLDHFKWIVLEAYAWPASVIHGETWSLCMAGALHDSRFYNKRAEEVGWRVKEPITDRHRSRLAECLMMLNK
jgi:hypothetical protein